MTATAISLPRLEPGAPPRLRPRFDHLAHWLVKGHWMQLEILRQYAPRPILWDRIPARSVGEWDLPQVAVITPSYNQAAYLPSTLESVLQQDYPRLIYGVQDGGSTDASLAILEKYRRRLAWVQSQRDSGQADAIVRGFGSIASKLGPDDVMAWLNSDDLYAPGALRRIGNFFAAHPQVDVVYGHRIIIDELGREIGRWVLPPHDPAALTWVDYVPQETLFWRKRAWDRAGGLDASFSFALDWDLLARFTATGARVARLPWFTACFRVHAAQKTSSQIHSTGAREMARVRGRFHGDKGASDWQTIQAWAARERRRGAVTARLLDFGIRV